MTNTTDAEYRDQIHAAVRRGIDDRFAGEHTRDLVRAIADQVLVIAPAPTPNAAIVAHANDTLALVSTILGASPLPKEPGTSIAFGDTRNQWWGYTRSWSGHLVPWAPADDEDHMQSDEDVIERRGGTFRVIARAVDTSGAPALDELLWQAII